MSYYILPKKNNNIDLHPIQSLDQDHSSMMLSHSLNYYLSKQIELSPYNEEVYKIINPYEFIFTKVPTYKFSVSKLKPPNNYFYILMEISYIFNLFDSFSKKDIITTMHFSSCPESTFECLDMLREDKQDVHIQGDLLNCLFNNEINNIDFLYFELEDNDYTNLESYFKGVVLILLNILTYQNKYGISIIKIDSSFHKPILDFIYILNGLFDKVYIVKPNCSNIFKNERFLVCKFFEKNIETQVYNELKLFIINYKKTNGIIISLLNNILPSYFLTKIEESNVIIGQQQLESYDTVINILKNKNKDDKIENIKKNNIQKCIQLCEKFKIPYNKFVDKVNIFLQGHVSEEMAQNVFLMPGVKEDNEESYEFECDNETVFENENENKNKKLDL
uniref:Ribosomal RNA methyltransferase FtsJ domain-containing protein n=1 Tax=viral metagenome TaxID=1070528 RepID=A0A6C0KUX6_9ZZZZ